MAETVTMAPAVKLHVDRVEGASPRRTVLFLHGILGSGANLRTLARRFVEAAPEWSVVLVDLRGHGRSPKTSPQPTLTSAARDILALVATEPLPVQAVLGHSFGGKVALEAARLSFGAPEAPAATDPDPLVRDGSEALSDTLEHLLIVDSIPGERVFSEGSGGTLAVVELLERLTEGFPTRDAFVDAVEAAGLDRPTGHWLAMSLRGGPAGLCFGLDMVEIRSLLTSYRDADLWPLLAAPPVAIHLVIGDRSTVFSADDRRRANELAAADARITVDVLPAGHWVHVDDARGLLRVLLLYLAAPR